MTAHRAKKLTLIEVTETDNEDYPFDFVFEVEDDMDWCVEGLMEEEDA